MVCSLLVLSGFPSIWFTPPRNLQPAVILNCTLRCAVYYSCIIASCLDIYRSRIFWQTLAKSTSAKFTKNANIFFLQRDHIIRAGSSHLQGTLDVFLAFYFAKIGLRHQWQVFGGDGRLRRDQFLTAQAVVETYFPYNLNLNRSGESEVSYWYHTQKGEQHHSPK